MRLQEGSIWKKRVYHWREAMEYFLIGMWRQCVPLLDDFDVVGAIVVKALCPPAAVLIGIGRKCNPVLMPHDVVHVYPPGTLGFTSVTSCWRILQR